MTNIIHIPEEPEEIIELKRYIAHLNYLTQSRVDYSEKKYLTHWQNKVPLENYDTNSIENELVKQRANLKMLEAQYNEFVKAEIARQRQDIANNVKPDNKENC